MESEGVVKNSMVCHLIIGATSHGGVEAKPYLYIVEQKGPDASWKMNSQWRSADIKDEVVKLSIIIAPLSITRIFLQPEISKHEHGLATPKQVTSVSSVSDYYNYATQKRS